MLDWMHSPMPSGGGLEEVLPVDADRVKAAINGAWAFCEEQPSALDRGLITEQQWFDNHLRHFTAHYLASDNPRGQSGHCGDEARYRYTHEMNLDALDGDGSFLDVGCANGCLIERLAQWGRERASRSTASGWTSRNR